MTPGETAVREAPTVPVPTAPAYAELGVASNFSFLRAASHPEGSRCAPGKS